MKPSIIAISGSVRPGNFTTKALSVVVDELNKLDLDGQLIEPAKLSLNAPGLGETDDSKALVEKVKNCAGVILSTPEYHGSYSSVIKRVIENLGFPSVLAGKPIALLGVAAGRIGAIKSLESLRGVCSHVGAIVLPGPVSVANVQKIFDEQGRCTDESTAKYLKRLAQAMKDYLQDHVCPKFALEAMVREKAL